MGERTDIKSAPTAAQTVPDRAKHSIITIVIVKIYDIIFKHSPLWANGRT